MDEQPTNTDQVENDCAMPNPLARLAEQVKIHVEKGEFPLAIAMLMRPENEALRKWAVVVTTRHNPKVDSSLHDRIERAIRMRPNAPNSVIARDLRCSDDVVRNVRSERRAPR